MHSIVRRVWDLPQRLHTPEDVFRDRRLHRRELLRMLGAAAAGTALPALLGCGSAAEPPAPAIPSAPRAEWPPEELTALFPAPRNESFTYGRPESDPTVAAEHTNFYEFTATKSVYRHVDGFQPSPWTVDVGGMCSRPRTFDLSDIAREFAMEERAYRLRCVEAWAMCIPWTGFPLRELLKAVEPQPAAKYVAFETFLRPRQAPGQKDDFSPWPYTEGLTIAEATNELVLLATGLYGAPLPRQHGAPLRLVVPWKYGYKSIKSIVRITLTDTRPATFWNTLMPHEYDFPANVDPDVPHPRWSQKTEWMLGTRERYDTVKYNGYGEYVGGLYGDG